MVALQSALSNMLNDNEIEETLVLDKLQDVAILRLSAILVTKWMITIFIEKQKLPAYEKNFEVKIISLVQKICCKNDLHWFR